MFDRQQHEAGLGKLIIYEPSYQIADRRTITPRPYIPRVTPIFMRPNGLRFLRIFGYAADFLLRAPRQ
jgi:hypothetical protein